MNPTSIEYVDVTWNPMVGCLFHCWYCYGRRIMRSSKCELCRKYIPHPHEERLYQPLKVKRHKRILLCSVSDLYFYPDYTYRRRVPDVVSMSRQHTFIVLTKNPYQMMRESRVERYSKNIPNLWCGTSIDTKENKVLRLPFLRHTDATIRLISLEPMLEDIDLSEDELHNIDWVIIGGLTLPKGRVQHPKREWVDKVVRICDRLNIPLFIKDNVGYRTDIREYPKIGLGRWLK